VLEKGRILSAYLDDYLQGLQAPVQAISGYAGFLLEQPAVAASPAVRGDVEHICVAAGELLTQMERVGETLSTADAEELSVFRHDLRNSISAVSGYVEMLLDDTPLAAEETCNHYLELIQREVQQFLGNLETLRGAQARYAGNTGSVREVFDSFRGGVRRESGDPGRVLVVDDNDSSRQLLVHQLQRQGHQTLEAASGRAGLDIMREQAPDLVLLDLLMPQMNGFEVLQAMREDETLRHLPVVMISGLRDEEGAIRCIEAGASDYLIKPVNATILRARIDALLERRRWQIREWAYREELEKSYSFVRRVFGRYLSDDVVKRLLDEQGGLTLGGERRQVTILTADIRGFSSISQQLSPEQCVQLLNNYLSAMTDIIMSWRGTVDEFIGDAILAIFGAPFSDEDDTDRAIACAIEMQQAVDGINAKNREQGFPDIEVGIGLNTGSVVVGNIGSERRSKYGIVGHHVNLTSRIEACTVGGQILASEYTLRAARAKVRSHQVLDVDVKGVNEPLQLFEVAAIGAPYSLELPRRVEHWVTLDAGLSVRLSLLRDKRVDGLSGRGSIIALSERCLRLQSSLELPELANLSIRLPGSGQLADPFYAKVTGRGEDGEYTLTCTSLPAAVAQYLQSRHRAGSPDREFH
jgi:adenylate cyclase